MAEPLDDTERRLKDMRNTVQVNSPSITIVTKGGSLLHYSIFEAERLYAELGKAIIEQKKWYRKRTNEE